MFDICVDTERLIIRPVLNDDFETFVSGYSNCLPAKN